MSLSVSRPEEPEPPDKKAKKEAPLVVALANAARIKANLQERLGSQFRVAGLSVEEVQAGAADEAVALVVPPMPLVNTLVPRLPQLRLLQTMSAGVEFLDMEKCSPSLTVCKTSSMDHGIAEYVFSAMLHWQVQLLQQDSEFKLQKSFMPPYRYPGCTEKVMPARAELGGKVVGLIGFGGIGQEVAKRAQAFNMRVLVVTQRARQELPPHTDWCGTQADLPKLLRESHFVVVCCALTEDTRGLIDASALASMQSDAVLINVARGPVVDEDAMYEALQKRTICGAVLDVWWQYPSKEAPEVMPSKHAFHELGNVLMTPHSSGWTAEQEVRKISQIAQNIQQLSSAKPAFIHVCKARL